MIRVTDSILAEVMDDKIVRTFGWSFKNRRDSVMSRRSANGESKVSGQRTQGALKHCCQYAAVKGDW